MKKIIALLFSIVAIVCSCSTDVDIYTETYKDTTIVYGVLDVANDTNFIRIERGFAGSNDDSFDAYNIALIEDSSNYPGKLDARFIEYKKGLGEDYAPTGREIVLDTTTLHNKQEGIFYAPNQKVYYTTETFRVNNPRERFKYKLLIPKANDTVSSEISLIGNASFHLTSSIVFFKAEDAGTREFLFSPDNNEAVYQITMQFNYKEKRAGQDTIHKNVNWTVGPFNTFELGHQDNDLALTYREDILFSQLSRAIGDDILNVERFYESFVVTIYAYSKELDDYIMISAATSGVEYYYTNIHGGLGILSSCHEIQGKVDISSRTKTDLLAMPWGFKNIGYNIDKE